MNEESSFLYMFSPKGKPLAGKRILVPPARPEANPILHILARRGAEAAGRYGLTPDIISQGHIADLAESLTDYFGKVKES